MSETYRTIYFIADYHALTTLHEGRDLNAYVYDVAATWLACGLDPEQTILFRQSDVIEVFELSWVLSCLFGAGHLMRGHSYKDALAKGDAPNAGILFYPMLMAADILLYDTHAVPVGKDQRQHVEITRDVANRFGHVFGKGAQLLVPPEPVISEAPLVAGTDGEKMSKSRGNAIPLFDSAKALKKVVMSIKTDSLGLNDPKNPDTSTIYALYAQVAPGRAPEMAAKMRAGTGYGYGHAKKELLAALEDELGPARERFAKLRAREDELDAVLQAGAERARRIARATMTRVRHAVGMARGDIRSTLKLKKP